MNSRTIIFIAAAIATASCTDSKPAESQQSLMDASRQELVDALGERDRLLALVKEISAGMEQIKQMENMLSVDTGADMESAGKRARILADIKALRLTLQERRKRLEELDGKLKESVFYTDELQGVIDAIGHQIDAQASEIRRLQKTIESANSRISMLTSEVDSLCITVETTRMQRDSVESVSESLENELNACYYVVAPKSVLKEHNIIETAFLRKTRLMRGDFDKGVFRHADKRNGIAIDCGSGSIKIYTNHPDGTYSIVEQSGRKILHITDPQRFWSLGNYLIVQTD